jgi:NitT/TauT family transport system permease protein
VSVVESPSTGTAPAPWRRAFDAVWPPLLFFLLFMGAWDAAVRIWRPPPYLVPGPLAVLRSFGEHRAILWNGTLATGKAALAGFALSFAAGAVAALLFAQFAILRRACYPYAIFLQTVPIVAIAPLLILWFGYGFNTVVASVFIVSLFPIVANGTEGLLNVDPRLLELFASNNATRWQTMMKLRLPSSIPSFATGAKISSGLSVIGAIVGEFMAGFEGSHRGLGYVIILANKQLQTDQLFAAILCSTLLGLAIFGAASWIDAALLGRWRHRA